MEKIKIDEIINRNINIKEFRDYKLTEDDCLVRWRQDIIEWLRKPLDVDINMRDKDDEV